MLLCILNMINDENNQQDATTFSFINLLNSALHVSGDKFAHSQEPFLTVQGVTGGTDQTLGECSLGHTIPI